MFFYQKNIYFIMNDDLQKRLKMLKTEDYVWFILIGIILLSLYNNTIEKKFLLFNDLKSKEKYRDIQIFIFLVVFIIYLYFAIDGYKDINSLKPTDSKEKIKGTYLSFISGVLIAIATGILLYIAIFDKNVETEIFFN